MIEDDVEVAAFALTIIDDTTLAVEGRRHDIVDVADVVID
jgi:hypothetical protein